MIRSRSIVLAVLALVASACFPTEPRRYVCSFRADSLPDSLNLHRDCKAQ